jgi:isopentenyl phosphate kinase
MDYAFYALLKKLVELDYISVLYGDIIPTEFGGQVVSEAKITELIYEYFPINRIIVCSSMDGVPINAQNPSMGFVSKINSENINQVLDNLGNSSLVNIKGALQEKLKIIYNVAVRAGINAQIINGAKANMLYQSLYGNESLGTLIVGQTK